MSKYLIIFALFCGLLTSCQVTSSSKIGAPATAITKTVLATHVVEKGEDVQATVSSTKLFYFFEFGPNKFADGAALPSDTDLDQFASLKSAAVFAACEKAGADILIAPSYSIQCDDYAIFSRATCTVKGFTVKIKGIEKLDQVTLSDYLVINSLTQGKTANSSKGKSIVGFIFLGPLGLFIQ